MLKQNRFQWISDQETYSQCTDLYYWTDDIARIIYLDLPLEKIEQHKKQMKYIRWLIYLLIWIATSWCIWILLNISNGTFLWRSSIITFISTIYPLLIVSRVVYLYKKMKEKQITDVLDSLVLGPLCVLAPAFMIKPWRDLLFFHLIMISITIISSRIRSKIFNINFVWSSLKKDTEWNYIFPFQ